ncbi:MAG: ABC transporter permease subunit [Planctomycetota bacterium]|nr:ABC transporter permease subunit [Planctomycetota bacterium]
MFRGARGYLLYGLGFFVVLEIMLVAAVYWWPTFEQNLPSIKAIAAPIKMLSSLVDQVDQFGVSGYIVGQHFFKGCSALGTAAAVLFGANAIAGEAHRGTMEVWLARPVSRRRLMGERWFGGLLVVIAPVFASSTTVPALLGMFDKTMAMSDLMRCSVHMSAFLAAIYSVAFLWSCYGSEPMRISFVMLFASVMVFALYLVEGVTHYSLYRLVEIKVFMRIITEDAMNWTLLAPMLGCVVIAYALSSRAFLKRVP